MIDPTGFYMPVLYIPLPYLLLNFIAFCDLATVKKMSLFCYPALILFDHKCFFLLCSQFCRVKISMTMLVPHSVPLS